LGTSGKSDFEARNSSNVYRESILHVTCTTNNKINSPVDVMLTFKQLVTLFFLALKLTLRLLSTTPRSLMKHRRRVPTFLHIGRRRQNANFTPQPIYSLRIRPRYVLNRKFWWDPVRKISYLYLESNHDYSVLNPVSSSLYQLRYLRLRFVATNIHRY
jgi:hypothetical protein